MTHGNKIAALAAAVASVGLTAGVASAQVTIDNDIASGTFGSVSAEIGRGGSADRLDITARRDSNGQLVDTQLLFDYISYVDVGPRGGGISLASSAGVVTSAGDDAAQSSGTFTGSLGNTIAFSVVSSIANRSDTLVNTYTFTAQGGGGLGALSLIPYVDQDVLGLGDDILFTRGSAADANLQVFTVDNAELIGTSQSGAFTTEQGLVNATFDGFAADEFADLRTAITAGGTTFSPTGNIDTTDLPSITRTGLGQVFGEADVTTALSWTVDPNATTATIIATLGGVPDAASIPVTPPPPVVPPTEPPVNPPTDPGTPAVVPLPAGAWTGLASLAGLAIVARRRKVRAEIA